MNKNKSFSSVTKAVNFCNTTSETDKNELNIKLQQ